VTTQPFSLFARMTRNLSVAFSISQSINLDAHEKHKMTMKYKC